jgi:hypothetical protein
MVGMAKVRRASAVAKYNREVNVIPGKLALANVTRNPENSKNLDYRVRGNDKNKARLFALNF